MLVYWMMLPYFDVVSNFKACSSFSAAFAPLNTLS
jgi:hypothetical protein